MSTPLFPLFADLRDRPVLVVGGGTVARRKVAPLLAAGAQVRVGAPTLEPELAALAAAGRLQHLRGEFSAGWLDGVWLVIAATDAADVNAAVALAAGERRIFANIVDDGERSSWHSPARVERGALQVAISSGGGAPMLARHLREQLETQLDESLGGLAELLGESRRAIRRRWPRPAERRRFLEQVLAGDVPVRLRAGDRAGAEAALARQLDAPRGPAVPAPLPGAAPPHAGTTTALPDAATPGHVALVGAGPGDPGLLTLRALRLLNQADVILHDHLVDPGVLAMARRDALFVDVGKQSGDHRVSQDDIHALLLAHARAGRFVVRLKGGDPFVFGRGGEELQFLHAHGIGFEVVPGITAALACAAHAGVPLTHRDHAQSLRLVTAHARDSQDTLDWPALARERQTLAVYMGVAALPRLRTNLLAHGRDPTTPFALVENGGRRQQRVITGTLADLPELGALHAVVSPALLILGEVAALASTLHWYGAAPLGAEPPAAASPGTAPPAAAPQRVHAA